MYIYFGEHVDGGPLTPPVHVNLALNASAFENMSVDVGLSGRTHLGDYFFPMPISILLQLSE